MNYTRAHHCVSLRSGRTSTAFGLSTPSFRFDFMCCIILQMLSDRIMGGGTFARQKPYYCCYYNIPPLDYFYYFCLFKTHKTKVGETLFHISRCKVGCLFK